MSMISGVMKGCETETVSALKMNRMKNGGKLLITSSYWNM
jgi:hypothetical protein